MQSSESPTNHDLKQTIQDQQKIIEDQKRQLAALQSSGISALGKRVSAGKWAIGIVLGVATTALGVGEIGAVSWEMMALGLGVCLWSAYQAREDLRTVNKVKASSSTFAKLLQPDRLKADDESNETGVKIRSAPVKAQEVTLSEPKKTTESVSTTASTLLMFGQQQKSKSLGSAQVPTGSRPTASTAGTKK